MKLGLLVTRADAATTVAAAEQCEQHGLDSIWLCEDLWHRGSVPLATACALATERIRVGIGVANPYIQHPTLLAMNYGVLSEMSRGRVVLGIGASVAHWIEQMGMEYKLPRTSTKEAIEITRELLATGKSSYQGRAFALDEIELGFSVEYPTPLYMGSMGERSVRTTGEIADGWVVSILEPVGYLRTAREWLREGAAAAGRDGDALDVVQYLPFACGPDSAAAKDEAKDLVGLFILGEIELYREQAPVMSALSAYLETVSAAEYGSVIEALSAGVPAREAITEALVDELAISGTPEECVALLRRYEEAGLTEAVLMPAAAIVGGQIRPLLNH